MSAQRYPLVPHENARLKRVGGNIGAVSKNRLKGKFAPTELQPEDRKKERGSKKVDQKIVLPRRVSHNQRKRSHQILREKARGRADEKFLLPGRKYSGLEEIERGIAGDLFELKKAMQEQQKIMAMRRALAGVRTGKERPGKKKSPI